MNRVFLLFLISILTVPFSEAQGEDSFVLTGVVLDGQARPVTEAEVVAYEKFFDYSTNQEHAQILGTLGQTNIRGEFRIPVKIANQYNVFVVARKSGLAYGWDGLNYSRNTKFHTHFHLILEESGIVSGRVTDEEGRPVAGAQVVAAPKTSYLDRLSQRPIIAPKDWFTTRTDAKGRFAFPFFAADVSVDFWVKAAGWESQYKFSPHRLSGCGYEVGRKDIQLVLPQEVSIEGRVLEANSEKGVGGVQIHITPENQRECIHNYISPEVVSDPNGRFRFAGIPPGRHALKLVKSEGGNAEQARKTVGLDTSQGKPIDNVILRELGQTGILDIIVKDGQTNQSVTDIPLFIYGKEIFVHCQRVPGNKETLCLPAGEYKIRFGGDNTLYQSSEEIIPVEEGKTAKREILLERHPMVTGIVQDETGAPAAGAWVKLQPFGHEAYTDAEGRFRLVNFEERSRQCIMVRDAGKNLAGVTEFKPGTGSGDLTVVLKPALTASGEILDSEGRPIPAARITFYISIANCLSDVGAEVIADSQGRYEVRALPPATELFTYRVSIHAAGYGPRGYEHITIKGTANESVKLETIQLKPADQSITGMVVDSEGKAAGGVPLFIQGKGQPERTSATDSEGKFAIHRICAGKLRVQAGFSSDPKGAGFLEAAGGDRDVKIILGQRLVHSREISLCGKALPDLKPLELTISPEEIRDKHLLLCFFDMNQRPSRRCIRELAEKAEDLKSKGIVIVGVHASNVDEIVLKNWLSENKITFPVGIITVDVEETLFKWGVKSQPWLILTDQQHIVRAEGFGIDELDEKLKQVKDKGREVNGKQEEGGVSGDIELLRIMADGYEANLAKLRTWQGQATIDYSWSIARDGLQESHRGKIKAEFLIDRDLDALRWIAHTLECHETKNGEQHSLGADLRAGMTKGNCDYNLHVPTPLEEDYPRIIAISPKGKGMWLTHFEGLGFDPLRIFKEVSLVPFPERMRNYYENAGNPDMTPSTITRKGDLVIFETKGKNVVERYICDMSKGCNICEYFNSSAISETHWTLDYEKVAGVFVINNVSMSYQDNRTARKHISRRQAKLTTTMVNKPVDESEFTLAKIGLRLGERIRDRRTGFEYVYGEKGATDADMPPGKTLVGRSLPELEALALKPDTGQRQDKTMLICFWDKEQRSSRHCIQELAKRNEDLKNKGIVVVGVHASKVDESVLKNWLSENKITFPVGIITVDVEETLFKWGVKSQPWLILTDTDHIVRAEGFGVSELEEKIAAIKVK